MQLKLLILFNTFIRIGEKVWHLRIALFIFADFNAEKRNLSNITTFSSPSAGNSSCRTQIVDIRSVQVYKVLVCIQKGLNVDVLELEYPPLFDSMRSLKSCLINLQNNIHSIFNYKVRYSNGLSNICNGLLLTLFMVAADAKYPYQGLSVAFPTLTDETPLASEISLEFAAETAWKWRERPEFLIYEIPLYGLLKNGDSMSWITSCTISFLLTRSIGLLYKKARTVSSDTV